MILGVPLASDGSVQAGTDPSTAGAGVTTCVRRRCSVFTTPGTSQGPKNTPPRTSYGRPVGMTLDL